MKRIEELLGWHQDWPNGSAGYKVWFDADRYQRNFSPPTIKERLSWINDHVQGYVVSKRDDTDWEITLRFVDCQTFSNSDLTKLLDDTIRFLQGEK